jgi:hypothetical protein
MPTLCVSEPVLAGQFERGLSRRQRVRHGQREADLHEPVA